MHRKIKPIKKAKSSKRLLLKNADGNVTASKAEEGQAIKEYLAVRGKGELMAYADLLNRSRQGSKILWRGNLNPAAVVGALDLRKRSA